MRKKNTSDRKKLKSKYTNIKKRHDRKIKLKKDMKQNPNNYHKKKSDPGVPNSAPFKLALMDEREKYLTQKSDEKDRNRQKVLKARQAMKEKKPTDRKRKLSDVLDLKSIPDIEDDAEQPMGNTEYTGYPDEEMFMDTNQAKKRKKANNGKAVAAQGVEEMELDDEAMERRQAKKDAKNMSDRAKVEYKKFLMKHDNAKNKAEEIDPDPRFHNWSDKVYYKQVKLVVEAADVLLEVVDARDPLGTRCPVLESIIRSHAGKKLVFVLNKSDLIPKNNLQDWLKWFRAEGPTVAFKAATQRAYKFKKNVDRWVHMGQETLHTPSSMGADVLLQLLKNYARSYKGLGIVVGVVGLPNVGKSSLINSLKKVKTCAVAPIPGSTRYIKEIKLDSKLHLIDSPGVVLPTDNMNPVDAVLRNIVRIEAVLNPVDAATEIFNRSDNLKLALFYKVSKVDTAEEFLGNLARRCKKMIKTGLSDKDAAARRMIYDWNHGVLKYYTVPPHREEADVNIKVVPKLSAAFELETLASQKEEVFLSYMSNGRPSTTMVVPASKPLTEYDGLDFMQQEQTTAVDGDESDTAPIGDTDDDASDSDEDGDRLVVDDQQEAEEDEQEAEELASCDGDSENDEE